ncbi:hypothetical protein V1522DRAFT_406532 [Lipomyces starkeyi]
MNSMETISFVYSVVSGGVISSWMISSGSKYSWIMPTWIDVPKFIHRQVASIRRKRPSLYARMSCTGILGFVYVYK